MTITKIQNKARGLYLAYAHEYDLDHVKEYPDFYKRLQKSMETEYKKSREILLKIIEKGD